MFGLELTTLLPIITIFGLLIVARFKRPLFYVILLFIILSVFLLLQQKNIVIALFFCGLSVSIYFRQTWGRKIAIVFLVISSIGGGVSIIANYEKMHWFNLLTYIIVIIMFLDAVSLLSYPKVKAQFVSRKLKQNIKEQDQV